MTDSPALPQALEGDKTQEDAVAQSHVFADSTWES